MRVPDAWDACGGCGHDRDDHDRLGEHTAHGCLMGTISDGIWQACECRDFEEPS